MFKTLANIFRIQELRNKILFTVAMLCIYRIGFHVPLPGVNAKAFAEAAQNGVFGMVANYLSLFSGGGFKQSTIFGLGIMPYISASIIIQLLSTVVPSIEKLKKEGEPGMRKINEWTRYLAVPVCVVQSSFLIISLLGNTGNKGEVLNIVNNDYKTLFVIMGVVVMTAGSIFLMWLGEQIEAYGIGNGISLIIAAGIVCNFPAIISDVFRKSPLSQLARIPEFYNTTAKGSWIEAIKEALNANAPDKPYEIYIIAFLALAFVAVVAGSILLTQAQRRIRITQAKHMRGRKVYGGQNSYLPLRVNHSGVMPIIFASSLLMLPQFLTPWLLSKLNASNVVLQGLVNGLRPAGYLYEVFYISMIFFFSYFWNTVQFQPKEMADQLRDYGSFIPGLRPGKRTADYLEAVMSRITYVGAAFLCVIAIVPSVIGTTMLSKDPDAWQVTQMLGGTSLLIVIQVMLDLVNRIEANLVMRNYTGFLDANKGTDRQRNRIRGPVGSKAKNFRGNKEELQK